MSGFNANVAARKPRTGIGRVISELSSQPVEETPAADEKVVAHIAEAAPEAPPPPAAEKPVAASTARSGREQVERLRERLAAAAKPPLGEVEPQRTAAAVRDLVDGLRARLDMAVREKSELAGQLMDAQAALSRAQAELQKERRMRAAVEAQAEERQKIADDAVAEAEALAAERDQVLVDLAEQRKLESEQSALLLEAEAVLGRRDAERNTAARDLADARELLELAKADMADLEARLQAEAADKKRIEMRCRELEAELARMTTATAALESIEAITRGR
jgi:hypothetical protein